MSLTFQGESVTECTETWDCSVIIRTSTRCWEGIGFHFLSKPLEMLKILPATAMVGKSVGKILTLNKRKSLPCMSSRKNRSFKELVVYNSWDVSAFVPAKRSGLTLCSTVSWGMSCMDRKYKHFWYSHGIQLQERSKKHVFILMFQKKQRSS